MCNREVSKVATNSMITLTLTQLGENALQSAMTFKQLA